MPELPEVENTRLSLEPVLGQRVTRVRLLRRDVLVVPGDPIGGWGRQRPGARAPKRYTSPMLLNGFTVSKTLRRGKRMAVVGTRGTEERAIEIGLGMSGRMEIMPARIALPSHTHVVWFFENAQRLIFVDHRRFGGVWAWTSVDEMIAHWDRSLGPDALTIRAATLRALLSTAKRPLKAALLDQRVLCGVGNIYADEACFEARVAPQTIACSLRSESVTTLARAIRRILNAAIKQGGSTVQSFANANGTPGEYQQGHRVYGRGGEPCLVCGRALEWCELAQRTTVWCPVCQSG